MPTHQIKFGSLVLTSITETLTETADNRVNIQQVANRHGGIVTDNPVLDAKKITVTGKVFADDATTLRDTLTSMETSLGTSRQRLYTLFDDRYYFAYKDRFQYRYIPGSAMLAAEYTIEFLADDPFEYKDPDPSTTTITLTAADTPVGGGRYKETFSITNNGTAYSYLTVVTTANQGVPVTQVIVRNLTTAKQFEYNGALAIGEVLTVDHGSFSVSHSVQGSQLTAFSGSFIYLDSGLNSLEVQGEPATYAITYKERYY